MDKYYQLLINQKVYEVPHELYLNKLFVNMAIVLGLSIGLQVLLDHFGIFNNPGPVIFTVIAIIISLIINKLTGNIALAVNSMLVGIVIIMCFIIHETGGIYSYGLRWLICVLLISYLFSNNMQKSLLIPVSITFLCLGTVLFFYYLSIFENETFLLKKQEKNGLDHAIDNIMFIITLSLLSFMIQRVKFHLINDQKDKNERLEAANQELERFAFIASHDLKEPVRNICSFSQLALSRLEKNDPEGAKDFLQYVVNNSFQMNDLIKNTLNLMSQNNSPMEPVDLNIILKQVSALIKEERRDQPFNIKVPDALPTVTGSSNELLTCIKHLVSNGLTFNQSDHPQVVVKSESRPGEDVISIEDNGKGIEPQYQEQIFLMYKRLENRSVYTGSGLGLSICKKLIERWGGRIWVDSKLGKGSVFYVSIPK